MFSDKKDITCLIAACALCLPVKVQGQVLYDTLRSESLQEVPVDASRTSQTSSVSTQKEADKSLMQAASALQISDALKYFSGATVKDYGGIGGLKTVSVRGLGASHTAVAYDGVIITDNQTGQIDLGKFSSSQAESVRMVSGPDNDMLQPAALAAQAAVISINTGRPQLEGVKSKSSAQLKYGSYNTLSAQAESAFKAGKRNMISLQGEWLKTDGNYPYTQDNGLNSKEMRRDNSDVQRLRFEGALFSDIGRYYTLDTRAYWFQSEQGLPANILYNENAARERLWNRNGFVQSTLTARIYDRGILRFSAKYSLTDTRYLDPKVSNTQGMTDNRYIEQEGYFSFLVYYHLYEHLSFSFGSDIRASSLDGNGAQQASPFRITVNNSAALKYASERITLTARLNQVVTSEETKLRQAADNFKRYSPTAGLNWLVWPAAGLHIRASFSNTFRLPTFNDLYFEQIGRRDLRPEQASVTSAGMLIENEVSGIRYSVYADVYNSYVKDRIMAVPGKNTAVWMMKNIGRVTVHGLETGMELRASEGSVRPALLVSYTYQRSMDKTDSGSTTWNHQLPYTPRHSASAVAWVDNPIVNVSCNLIYSGEYYCNGYNGPQYHMPSYYELGCSLWRSFRFETEELALKAECINLTDSRYELVRNYPMPGRQFRITVSLDL